MNVDLDQAGAQTSGALREIGCFADQEGVRAFLVGGAVRDVFLRRPFMDIDVVLETDAVRFARKFASSKKCPLKEHKQFGTAAVSDWKGFCVDFVTARSEIYPSPGALPVVRPGSLKDDVFRRDFTVNALAVSINREDFGTLIDLCGGCDDLMKGRIRVFHQDSFLDDPTRILRAVRFEQRFRFRFTPKTMALLKAAVFSEAYRTVSAPRYFQEFARGFFEDESGRYLLRLKALGALDFLGRDIVIEKRVLSLLDDQKRAGIGPAAADPQTVYISALYAGCSDTRIMDQGTAFQWGRERKKKIVGVIDALRCEGLASAGSPARRAEIFRRVLRG